MWDLASPSRVHQEIVSGLHVRLKTHTASQGDSCKVRECWICDPQRGQVLCYDFDSEHLFTTYDFSEPVSSVTLPWLQVHFGRFLEDM